MNLGFKINTRIKKPVKIVFDAVIKPESLNQYFTHGARGELIPGAEVYWNWSNTGADEMKINVNEVVVNEKIKFSWQSSVGYDTDVEFSFKEIDGVTQVTVHESGWKMDQKSIESSYDNCSGWEHMTQCLKAHLQHGIDLRG